MFGRGRGRGGKPAENTGFIVRSVCVCARMCVCVFMCIAGRGVGMRGACCLRMIEYV